MALWSRVLDRVPPRLRRRRPLLQAALAVELLYKPGTHERATAAGRRRGCRRCAGPAPATRSGSRAGPRRPGAAAARPAAPPPARCTTSSSSSPPRLGDALGARRRAHRPGVGPGGPGQARRRPGQTSTAPRTWRVGTGSPRTCSSSAGAGRRWQQMEGDFAGAEATIGELEALQATLAMAGEGIGLCQRAILRWLQGRLPELEPALGGAPPSSRSSARCTRSRWSSAGRLDEARALLGPWSDQPPLPWDYLWAGFTAVRAYIWAALGTPRPSPTCARTSRRTPTASSSARCRSPSSAARTRCSGSSRRAAGDLDAARDHLTKARAAHEAARPAAVGGQERRGPGRPARFRLRPGGSSVGPPACRIRGSRCRGSGGRAGGRPAWPGAAPASARARGRLASIRARTAGSPSYWNIPKVSVRSARGAAVLGAEPDRLPLLLGEGAGRDRQQPLLLGVEVLRHVGVESVGQVGQPVAVDGGGGRAPGGR